MDKLLDRAFQIRPHERAVTLAFFAFFVGIGMFYTVASTVGDTLFLSHLPAQEVPRRLPWVYVGIAIANVLTTFAFDAVQRRVSRVVSIVGTQIVLAAVTVLARQLVDADHPLVYFALLIWLEASSLLSITLFFSFAGDYFTPRDARRLYGFIAGGMALGTVLMGNAIHFTVDLLGTRNLLYVGAGLLGVNAGIAALVFRVGKPVPLSEEDGGEAAESNITLRALLARPYVRALALIVPLVLIVQVTVDYQMKWVASAKSEQDLAQFFGSFYAWVGVAQIIVQFALVPRLLKNLGILSCLMVLPLTVGLASTALWVGSFAQYFGLGLLTLAASANFVRLTLSETLDLPSRELLFLPLPSRVRQRVQPLFGGALAPAAQGLGGLLMLGALALEVRVQTLSLAVVACTGVLLVLLSRLRPKYRETLAATLREHQLDATDLEQVLSSPDAESLIASLLASDDVEVVKSTFGLLAQRELGTLAPVLERLVESPHADVAIAALERLAAEKDPRFVESIRRAWDSPNPRIRQAAVLAMCEASGEGAVERVSIQLGAGDHELRVSALIGLARHCGPRGVALVRPSLEAQARSEYAALRAEAARTMGRIARPGYADLLDGLLGDTNESVRAAAAEACGECGDPALVPALFRVMQASELRGLALRALGAMPPAAVPALVDRLQEDSRGPSERGALLRVLARIGGAGAAGALWDEIGSDRPLSQRLTAAEGLRSLRARGALPTVVVLEPEPHIERACHALDVLVRATGEVGRADAFAYEVLRDHARLTVELVFALLGLDRDLQSLARIQHNVLHEPRDAAVRALELFEEVLPRRLASRVVAALARWLEEPAKDAPGLRADTQRELLASESWIRVATVHHLNQGAAYPTVEAGALDDRERALYQLLNVVQFLKKVGMFRDLAAYHLVEQAEIAEWLTLEPGETLFRQGDEGDALYIVCQGTLEVLVGGNVVATAGEGECIGELALLDGEPRSATVIAREDASLLRVAADRWKHLLVTQSATARAMLKTLDRRIRGTQAGGPSATEHGMGSRRTQFMRAQKLNLTQLVSTMSFLQQVELFRELSTTALANLAGIAQEVVVYQGDTLFEEGEPGESLYLVCTGKLSISVNEREVAVLERNACLGEMALISGLPRSATAIALSEGRLLRIGSDDFMSLLSTEPEIALALLKTLAGRLRSASRHAAAADNHAARPR